MCTVSSDYRKDIYSRCAAGLARLLLLAVCMVAGASVARAEQLPKADVIRVPAIGEGLCVSNTFQSNMVIQRDKPLLVWGWATPEEKVTVRFAGQEASATAGADRKWKVSLQPVPVNATPQGMTIAGASQTITLENILIGDVWLLGGQSNMEFPLHKVENGHLEIVSAHYPQIRILTVPSAEGPKTVEAFPRLEQWSDWSKQHFHRGFWEPCTPDVVDELSAIGYVFARRVHMASQVPIGVINISRGGTSLETWTPLPLMQQMESPYVKAKLDEWQAKIAAYDPQKDLESRVSRFKARIEQLKKEGKPIPADLVEPTEPGPSPALDMNNPGNCYAGMISPIAGLSVKGAIWHQGYNNAFDGYNGSLMYLDLFPEMIRSWREAFNNDATMAFGIISQETEGPPQTRDNYCEMMYNSGIYIREAHYKTFLKMQKAGDKNIGYADTYDLRRPWYHPQLKLPAGERMARWALATQYGIKNLEWQPPMIVGMEAKEGSLVLQFDSPVGAPDGGAIHGFAIAGEDRHFQPAFAERPVKSKDDRGRPQYDPNKLVLTSPLVPNPVHYRYGWGRSPLANLQAASNKDLPVAAQRSDDWRMEEVPLGVLGENAGQPGARADQAKILKALRADDARRRLYEAEQVIKQQGQSSPASPVE